MNKRVFVESIIICTVLILGYYGLQIVSGMLLTMNYEPEILESYATIEHLEQKISFGTSHASGSVYWLLGCIGLSALYYGIRIAILCKRKNA